LSVRIHTFGFLIESDSIRNAFAGLPRFQQRPEIGVNLGYFIL
jgi:hypothetical protein